MSIREENDGITDGRLIDSREGSTVDVGAIGSVITLSPGNELSFITPRLVTGIWKERGQIREQALSLLWKAIRGRPVALLESRRVNRDEALQARGLYVLDHFDATKVPPAAFFAGDIYEVGNNRKIRLYLLAITGDRRLLACS